MTIIPPEQRQFVLIANENDLSDILKNAKAKDSLASWINPTRMFNFRKEREIFEAELNSFLRKMNPLLLFTNAKPQEMVRMISILVEKNLTWYSPEEAKKLFRFKPNLLPVSKTLYCKHPLDHDCYLLPASVNILLAQEKVFKFTELAAFLGAKYIKVDLDSFSSKQADFGASREGILSKIGLKVVSKLDSKSNIGVIKEYKEPKNRFLAKAIEDTPVELRSWLDYDPMFKSMATERIKYGLQKHTVQMDFKKMIEIDNKVVAKFISYGMEMGGHYEELVQTSWNFIVEYW
jgi:hypothetical protein